MGNAIEKSRREEVASIIGRTVTKSLLDEVNTTPKPGLVDLANNGSHRDMTPETFYASAEALKPFWERCFLIGVNCRNGAPEDCFDLLRVEGMSAEKIMLKATNGINTHKGAIFTLGTVCGAIGRLWRETGPCRNPAVIAEECARLCASAVKNDFAEMEAQNQAKTTGERLYLNYGLRGIRGELADGLVGVMHISLPCFEKALNSGESRNNAGVLALIHLIARGTDTNMIARGGMEAALRAAETAKALCAVPILPVSRVKELDQEFIQQNLSPGGCADLLAVTYFLHDWKMELR